MPTEDTLKEIEEIVTNLCMHSRVEKDGTITILYEGLEPRQAVNRLQALLTSYADKRVREARQDERRQVSRMSRRITKNGIKYLLIEANWFKRRTSTDPLIIENFACSEHGRVDYQPACPKCLAQLTNPKETP
jgi:hypothetical protein